MRVSPWQWAGQLGDGRAITLGEVVMPSGDGGGGSSSFEVQLKGAGPTPYSRLSDGRAAGAYTRPLFG
jgi:uncharacterized protein YdiU (UPF0061 family)